MYLLFQCWTGCAYLLRVAAGLLLKNQGIHANVLNQMLLHSRKLKSRGDAINDGDIIFAINDPAVIESHHLPKSTKRKPDLICLLAKKFASLFHKGSRHGFNTCMKTAAKSNGDNKEFEPLADAKTTWGDILQSGSWRLRKRLSRKYVPISMQKIF